MPPDASPPARCRQLSGCLDGSLLDPQLRDPQISLHPASFDDGSQSEEDLHPVPAPVTRVAAPAPRPSPQPRPTVPRRTTRRALHDALANGPNPFLPENQHQAGPSSQTAFSQEYYPGYDGSGNRIGLDHVRNAGQQTREGHYRDYLYNLPLDTQHPTHAQALPHISQQLASVGQPFSNTSMLVPGPSVGQVFPGMNSSLKTPHEILGLQPGAALDLYSLQNFPVDQRPSYPYHVLMKLAILGSPMQKLTLQGIIAAIKQRYRYFQLLNEGGQKAFSNSVRHSLSLLAAFVRVPKHVTEPGKGAYWTVDLSKGEGNKRKRKRNTNNKNAKGKKQKRSRSRLSSSPPEQQAGPSGSSLGDSSDELASARDVSIPPAVQATSQDESAPKKYKRITKKANAKNTAVKTGTSWAQSPAEPERDNFYRNIDPVLMEGVEGPVPVGERSPAPGDEHSQSAPETYLHSRHSGVGAHRERLARGTARTSPYPVPLSFPSSVSSSGSSSTSPSEYRVHHFSSRSPADMERPAHEHYDSSASPLGPDMNVPLPYYPSERFPASHPDQMSGYNYGHEPHSASSHSRSRIYSNGSPQESPLFGQPSLPPPIPQPFRGQSHGVMRRHPPSQLANELDLQVQPGRFNLNCNSSPDTDSPFSDSPDLPLPHSVPLDHDPGRVTSAGPRFGAPSFRPAPGSSNSSSTFARVPPMGFLAHSNAFASFAGVTPRLGAPEPPLRNERECADDVVLTMSAGGLPVKRRVPKSAAQREERR